MTREEIDTLWFQAMHESIRANEEFTRYRFAELVAAAEREACAKILDENAKACENNSMLADVLKGNAMAIRARVKNDR